MLNKVENTLSSTNCFHKIHENWILLNSLKFLSIIFENKLYAVKERTHMMTDLLSSSHGCQYFTDVLQKFAQIYLYITWGTALQGMTFSSFLEQAVLTYQKSCKSLQDLVGCCDICTCISIMAWIASLLWCNMYWHILYGSEEIIDG